MLAVWIFSGIFVESTQGGLPFTPEKKKIWAVGSLADKILQSGSFVFLQSKNKMP